MTITEIYPSKDTYVEAGANNNVNFGPDADLKCLSNTPTRRILIQFDLSTFLATDLINNATLFLRHLTTSGTGDVVVYPASDVWVENTVTWNTQPTIGTLDATQANSSSAPDWWSVDLTTAVAAMVAGTRDNKGWLIKMSPESSDHAFTAVSKNDGENPLLWPYLQINYTRYTVPTAPQNVVATAGSGKVTLEWDAPASDGGKDITAYKIYRDTTDQVQSTSTFLLATVDDLIETYDDENCASGTDHYYIIVAVNEIGNGADSTMVDANPFGPPGQPTNLAYDAIESGEVTLTWEEPDDDGGNEVISYVIYIDGVDDYTSYGPTKTITGLTNGTEYEFYVKAVNLAGAGIASDTITYTPGAVPATPVPSIASARASITVYWPAPASNGYAISAYKVYRGTVSGSLTLLGTTTSLYYTDSSTALVYGTTYYYAVIATNAVGDSAQSAEVSKTLHVPSLPRGVFNTFRDALYLERKLAFTDYGEETYNQILPLDGRVQREQVNKNAPVRDIEVAACKVFIDGNVTIDPGDRITLEDSTTRKVLSVKIVLDYDSDTLYKVALL